MVGGVAFTRVDIFCYGRSYLETVRQTDRQALHDVKKGMILSETKAKGLTMFVFETY